MKLKKRSQGKTVSLEGKKKGEMVPTVSKGHKRRLPIKEKAWMARFS